MKIRTAVFTFALLSVISTSYSADCFDDVIMGEGAWVSLKNGTGVKDYAYTHISNGQRKTYDNFRLRVTLSAGHQDQEWLNQNRSIPKIILPSAVNGTSEFIRIQDPEKKINEIFTDKLSIYVSCNYLNHTTRYSSNWVMSVVTLVIDPPTNVRKIELDFKGIDEGKLKELGIKNTQEFAADAPPKLEWKINASLQKTEVQTDRYPTTEPMPLHLLNQTPSEPSSEKDH